MPRTLLVAEPDVLQRQLVDLLLTQEDYELVFVSSGREALGYLKESTPALALLSLELPDITGAEICEKMKRVTRLSDVPVVLVASGEGGPIDAGTRELARFVGADLLLQKPLGDKNLRDRLSRLLERDGPAQRPRGPGGFSTEVLEETIDELKTSARVKALERENEGLRRQLATLEEELVTLREAHERKAVGSSGTEGRTAEDEVAELTRRNELLREELVKCKEGQKRGGLFGRRGS